MTSLPNPRRSFSLPVHQPNPNNVNRSRSSTGRIDESEDNIELLFSHSSARIVHFTASRSVSGRESGRIESLPFRNTSERTLASGPLRVYRVKFQCAFISSGAILHPLLPKSAAWCVDEENAIFVLRIRQNQYWRLELLEAEPVSILVEELKEVLDKVCVFERLPCPFRVLQIPEVEVEVPLPVFSKRQLSASRAQRKDSTGSLPNSVPSSVASSVDEHMFPLYMGDEPPTNRRRTQEARESDDVQTPLEDFKFFRRASMGAKVSAHISTFESIRAAAARDAESNPSSYNSSVNSSYKLVHGFEPKYFNGDRTSHQEGKFAPARLKPPTDPKNSKTLGSSAPSAIQTGRTTGGGAPLVLVSDTKDDVFSKAGKPISQVPEQKSKLQISKIRKFENDVPVIGQKLPMLQTKVGESSISAALNSPITNKQATPTRKRATELFNMAHSAAAPTVTTIDNVQNYVTSSPAAICFGLKSPDRNSISTPRSGVIRIPKRKEVSPLPIGRPNFDISPDPGDLDDYLREDDKYLGGADGIKTMNDADSSPSLSGLESDTESEEWSSVSRPSSPTAIRRRRGTTGSVMLISDLDTTRKGEDAVILQRDAKNNRITFSNFAHKATAIILNKTLDLAFMRPSGYVAAMMLRIAARVAAGTVVSAYYWTDWGNQEEEEIATIEPIDDDEYEDDFGVKLTGRRKDRQTDEDERHNQSVKWDNRGRRTNSGRIHT